MRKYFSVVLLRTTNLTTKKMVYEETFLQINAESETEAQHKAVTYAKSCETIYKNSKGEPLQVEFIKIGNTGELLRDEPDGDITELYARSFENFDEYIQFVL